MEKLIAHVDAGGLKDHLSRASSADELVKAAGGDADKTALSFMMRRIAGASLQKRGFPSWAIDSVLSGDAVCW